MMLRYVTVVSTAVAVQGDNIDFTRPPRARMLQSGALIHAEPVRHGGIKQLQRLHHLQLFEKIQHWNSNYMLITYKSITE